jgi:ParB-like chromosome segregation protein Spo0J
VRSPETLLLHPAFNELNLHGWLINSESQDKPQGVREPILITKRGILLLGFAEWHAAICAGQPEIDCTEYALNDDEALQLILTLHRSRAAWNDFTRTELALEQELYFQSKALANQVAGGKHKGLANLPEAQHIDVREKIADLAGVCSRTVGNVKLILKKAHPSVIESLHNGTITINAGLEICKVGTTGQVEELARYLTKRVNNKLTASTSINSRSNNSAPI